MRRRFTLAAGCLLVVAPLAVGLPAPEARACDAPGVSCSSEEAPPAALAPEVGARCEAPPAAPAPVRRARPRPRPQLVPLDPNGYNQGRGSESSLPAVLQRLERERARARAEARR